MNEWQIWALASLAVLFIGLSKAGFGGGLGMLTTPLCALVFPAKEAIGILLPLLCAGDIFSLWFYWGKWEKRNLKYLLPGVLPGVVIGVHFIGRFSSRELNIAIGLLAVLFAGFELWRRMGFRPRRVFVPGHGLGMPCGIAAGVTSSFAHGAGPVVSMFLIPQQLSKEIYVGTMVLVFSWINWIKVPFFVGNGVITGETLSKSIIFVPLIPVGVLLGVWLNQRFSERGFSRFVIASVLLTGLQLIFNFRF